MYNLLQKVKSGTTVVFRPSIPSYPDIVSIGFQNNLAAVVLGMCQALMFLPLRLISQQRSVCEAPSMGSRVMPLIRNYYIII